MKKCEKCGVLLDEGYDECPLCGTDEVASHGESPGAILRASRRSSLRYAWELSGILSISLIAISIVLDLLFGQGISWSLYPLTSVAWVWLTLTLLVFMRRRLTLLLIMQMAVTLGMLMLFDLFDKQNSWFVHVALPVTLAFFLLAGVISLLSVIAKGRGFNILAVSIIAINMLCVVIEIFTDLHLHGTIIIRWSAVVTAALIPVAAILMFLYYRLQRGRNLGSFFHI
ncbi:MAG: DUF6320 domain-containing protein [Bacteroidales bacterium]|jgi:hypothetical protein|nr:DUF6320 domain-containing protein [Bacteroidales bacterium]